MKQNEQAMEAYEAPKVEVIEVEVEQGFAVSYGDGTGSGNVKATLDGQDGGSW